MSKVVHYSHSYGAACSRTGRSKKWTADGRAALVTCKRCIPKAIPRGSEWVSLYDKPNVIIKEVHKNPYGMIFVMFEPSGFYLLQDFVSLYRPRL